MAKKDEPPVIDDAEAKAKAEADAKAQADAEAKAAEKVKAEAKARADAAAAAKAEAGLVKMVKDGDELAVDPSCVRAHEEAGWHVKR